MTRRSVSYQTSATLFNPLASPSTSPLPSLPPPHSSSAVFFTQATFSRDIHFVRIRPLLLTFLRLCFCAPCPCPAPARVIAFFVPVLARFGFRGTGPYICTYRSPSAPLFFGSLRQYFLPTDISLPFLANCLICIITFFTSHFHPSSPTKFSYHATSTVAQLFDSVCLLSCFIGDHSSTNLHNICIRCTCSLGKVQVLRWKLSGMCFYFDSFLQS